MKKYLKTDCPTISETETEPARLKSNHSIRNNIIGVILVSVITALLVIILTNLWFPVLRVMGSSMQHTLQNQDVVVCTDLYKEINRGEIIAFYNNDKILIKRVVGLPGDTIEIDNDGVLYINGERQSEMYVMTLSLEPCDISFPVKVPDDSCFVLGDRRTTSTDSRSKTVGMVLNDNIIGKVVFRIWPFNKLGIVD